MGDVSVYLSPGLFGFARLAGFDYLQHLQAALAQRFADLGRDATIQVADVHPSSSIRRRTLTLAQLVNTAPPGDGPIHLLGHSTGGLDLRLAVSPKVELEEGEEEGESPNAAWIDRVRSGEGRRTRARQARRA